MSSNFLDPETLELSSQFDEESLIETVNRKTGAIKVVPIKSYSRPSLKISTNLTEFKISEIEGIDDKGLIIKLLDIQKEFQELRIKNPIAFLSVQDVVNSIMSKILSKWKSLRVMIEDMKKIDKLDERVILVLGETGSGKSSLCNLICNDAIFKIGHTAASETQNGQFTYAEIGELTYRVVDTVGLNDTDKTNEEVLSIIMDSLFQISSKINIMILCIRHGRVNGNLIKTLNSVIVNLIGVENANHIYIVFTGSSNYIYDKHEQAKWINDSKKSESFKELFKNIPLSNIIFVDAPHLKPRSKYGSEKMYEAQKDLIMKSKEIIDGFLSLDHDPIVLNSILNIRGKWINQYIESSTELTGLLKKELELLKGVVNLQELEKRKKDLIQKQIEKDKKDSKALSMLGLLPVIAACIIS